MKRITVLIVVLIAILALTIPAFGAGQSQEERGAKSNKASNSLYIVQMSGDPAVVYEGGVPGFPATRPAPGKRINPNSPNVVKYVNHLTGRHDAAVNSVGGRKVYSYAFTYNGFAVDLTEKQADQMKKTSGVLAVTKAELVNGDTSSTPTFLGLTDPGSLWYQLGYPSMANRNTPGPGENIVIGIIDSGIWPEHPSFSDRNAQGQVVYGALPGFSARCVPGEQFTAANCNQKLVGAQYFNAAWGGDAGINAQRPWEFNSPRDYNGHGTHTASTAGGNYGVPTTGAAAIFGPISGIAPRARISAYKALWSTEAGDTASGFTPDLVAAIDRAVRDGVDVINYSISGSRTNFLDPVMVAFLNATEAGIFVAVSAGNSGPPIFTVAHPGPWVTTVAAGTHNRSGEGSVTLGNGDTYEGASLAASEVTAPLINSDDAALPGADPVEADLCYAAVDNGGVPVLDPAVVSGKIVVCERGVTARVNKSLAVQQAGGVGMILINPSANSLNADFHFVPTVHLQDTALAPVEAYADTAGATATIHQATIIYNAPAPFVASFSSRGPLLASGDVLKPDVIAPGQDILAGVSPVTANGQLFNLLSGTSMSSPHVAGVAALLKDKFPNWTPMMIKSAMMTTAYDVLLDAAVSNPLLRTVAQGAGHVDPNEAADPGLVFNAGRRDWMAFLCGATTAIDPATCAGAVARGFSLDPSDLNSASIAIDGLAGTQTIRRTVTNVSGSSSTYNVSYTGLAGFTVSFNPASFTVAPGASKTIEITFTRTTAALNAYHQGNITWTDGNHNVRVPVVLRPVALAAPAEVTGAGEPISYAVKFGYTGTFSAAPRGLVAATTETRTVVDDPTDGACSLTSPNAQLHSVAIPADTTYARFSLFDDFTDGEDDLDLCVFNPANVLVGSSGSGTSAEQVSLVNPAAGAYTVVVQGWGTDGPDAVYTLFHWLLGSTAAGNMAVSAPTAAVLGQTGTIQLTFSGLAPATKYLGSVAYTGDAGIVMPNPTIVRVDTP
jgi:subtilisin family serine protease